MSEADDIAAQLAGQTAKVDEDVERRLRRRARRAAHTGPRTFIGIKIPDSMLADIDRAVDRANADGREGRFTDRYTRTDEVITRLEAYRG